MAVCIQLLYWECFQWHTYNKLNELEFTAGMNIWFRSCCCCCHWASDAIMISKDLFGITRGFASRKSWIEFGVPVKVCRMGYTNVLCLLVGHLNWIFGIRAYGDVELSILIWYEIRITVTYDRIKVIFLYLTCYTRLYCTNGFITLRHYIRTFLDKGSKFWRKPITLNC